MFAKIMIKLENLPKSLREEAARYLSGEKTGNYHYAPVGYFDPDKKLGVFEFDAGNFLTLKNLQKVIDKLMNSAIDFDHIMLVEKAYLDDDAIKPPRGKYERGESTAEVDSYIVESSMGWAHPVWKIVIRGRKPQSIFELYSRIRQGLEQPKEWWDKKPVVKPDNQDK